MTGRTMKSRLDLIKPNNKSSSNKNKKMEQQFDDHHGASWKEFEVGDDVYIQLHEGNKKYKWTLETIIGNYSVFIESESRKIRAHENQLNKRFNMVGAEKDSVLFDYFDIQLPAPVTVDIEPEENQEDE